MADVVLLNKAESIATVTLNRPEAMNALSLELRRALVEAFRDVARDEGVGVVILTGAGRAFCAGIDLKELGGETGQGSAAQAVGGGGNVLAAMEECPRPIIGAVNGFAITGGFELALACDLLIASRAARFADTHARVGILPGWGLSQKLPRLIGIGRAKELSLTGNFVSAEQAAAWGLVNRVVEPEDLLPACRALAADMLSCDPPTLRAYKRLIDRGYGLPLADGLRLEREANLEHVKRVKPADVAERRRAIQERGRRQG
ncbi:MAG: enoyl-CoA hydratase [Deltaproteobacteria bacterium]|nr:enoyl-CoA hydratase [Deltaproteobacteria bacterium]